MVQYFSASFAYQVYVFFKVSFITVLTFIKLQRLDNAKSGKFFQCRICCRQAQALFFFLASS